MDELGTGRQPENTDAPEEEVLFPYDRPWPRRWQAPFLRALSVLPDISSAARLARINRQTAYNARTPGKPGFTPGFAEAWEEAVQLAFDYYDRHLRTWATTGVPVKQSRIVTRTKRDKDGNTLETSIEEFTTESAERSATIAIFFAKAWNPDRYRWSERVEATGADGGPIRVESVEEIDKQIAALSAEILANAGAEPVPVE